MAVRVRQDGSIFCAATHPEIKGDIYIDDALHYLLSVEAKVLVTEAHEQHKINGEWWWLNSVPKNVKIDNFYSVSGGLQ